MFRFCLMPVAAAALSAAGLASAAAAGNGAIERPAPQMSMPSGKPVALRPSHDFVATLNAIIAAQLVSQGQAQTDQSNPYRQPRPRPDREQMVGTTGTNG